VWENAETVCAGRASSAAVGFDVAWGSGETKRRAVDERRRGRGGGKENAAAIAPDGDGDGCKCLHTSIG